ncbi:hypothetical protein D9M72_591490 [compost metagenome]
MRQAGVAGGGEQGAVDLSVCVAGVQFGLHQITLEYVTLPGLAQIEGFQVALLYAQGLQLTVRGEKEFDVLAFAQAGETLGVLAAGEHVVHGIGRQSGLGENAGQGIALAHGDALPGRGGWSGGCA